VALEHAGLLDTFLSSLRHFADAGVSLASPFQDYDGLTEKAKHHMRLLYEFAVASAIALNGQKTVTVVGEKDTSQNNPDVSIRDFEIEGIACKVISSRSLGSENMLLLSQVFRRRS
jgi:hypothetical protein